MQEPIEDYLADVKASNAEGTFKKRLYDLKRYNNYLQEEDIDALEAETADIHRFLRRESQEFAPETVRKRYGTLKGLYGHLSGILDRIEEDPTEDLRDRSEYGKKRSLKHQGDEISYVTPEEIEQMIEVVPNPTLRNELLIRLLFQTGLRRGEAVRIELDDIDRERRSIHIYAPKTDSSRTVFYQESLDFLMDQWLSVYRNMYPKAAESPYLFIPKRGEQLTEKRVSMIIKEAAEEAGIQELLYTDASGHRRYRITAHTLRHGHAVQALKSGIHIRAVAEQMGHENVETTMQYLQIVEDDVEEAYRNWE